MYVTSMNYTKCWIFRESYQCGKKPCVSELTLWSYQVIHANPHYRFWMVPYPAVHIHIECTGGHLILGKCYMLNFEALDIGKAQRCHVEMCVLKDKPVLSKLQHPPWCIIVDPKPVSMSNQKAKLYQRLQQAHIRGVQGLYSHKKENEVEKKDLKWAGNIR